MAMKAFPRVKGTWLLPLWLLLALSLLVDGGKFSGLGPLTAGATQHVRHDGLKNIAMQVGKSSSQTIAQLLRESRARSRKALMQPQPGRVLDGHLSVLETQAVSPLVVKDYATRIRVMLEWIHSAGGSFHADHDSVAWLLEYADYLFFQGWPADDGRKLIAALRHNFPCFQIHGTVSLSRLERAIQGWSRHSVSHARPPLPWHAATAIVGYLLHRGEYWPAVALLMLFLSLVRPGELFSLCGKHLVAPMPRSGVPHWSVVLRHEEDLVRTKTGAFDESIAFDLPFHRFFLPTLQRLKDRSGDNAPLWRFQIKYLNELLRQATLALGLQELRVELYSFRHGGASRDIVSGNRDLMTVKKILRHSSDLTVRRYEKSGRLALELRKMPASIREFGIRVESSLGEILRRPELAPTPPSIHHIS